MLLSLIKKNNLPPPPLKLCGLLGPNYVQNLGRETEVPWLRSRGGASTGSGASTPTLPYRPLEPHWIAGCIESANHEPSQLGRIFYDPVQIENAKAHRIQKALDRMETAQSTHGQSPYDYVTDDQSGRRIHSLELVTSLPLWPMRQEATRS